MVQLLNVFFGCWHRHLTRPITPVRKRGDPPGRAYVVCLACGKQFDYDVTNMRIGKQLGDRPAPGSSDSGPFQAQY